MTHVSGGCVGFEVFGFAALPARKPKEQQCQRANRGNMMRIVSPPKTEKPDFKIVMNYFSMFSGLPYRAHRRSVLKNLHSRWPVCVFHWQLLMGSTGIRTSKKWMITCNHACQHLSTHSLEDLQGFFLKWTVTWRIKFGNEILRNIPQSSSYKCLYNLIYP